MPDSFIRTGPFHEGNQLPPNKGGRKGTAFETLKRVGLGLGRNYRQGDPINSLLSRTTTDGNKPLPFQGLSPLSPNRTTPLGVNSIESQQTFQQSFYSSVGHPVVLETTVCPKVP